MSLFAPDAVWDMSPWGMSSFEGVAAIRAMLEDWMGAYEHYEVELEELLDLGNGVVLTVPVQQGRPVGSTGVLELRQGFVMLHENGVIERVTAYPDPDEARAAAEQLAQERE